MARRIFTSSEISAADFVDALNNPGESRRLKIYFEKSTDPAILGWRSSCETS